jgi:short-subunit dehydrogenase
MLVNNVGTNYLGLHQDITYEQVADVVNINCVSMTVLTACLVKKLNERGKSGIINVSSLAGDRGIPYLGLYSASKSFTNKLT